MQNIFPGENFWRNGLNPDSSFFFAKRNGQPIGYLKINRDLAQTVLPNEGGLEIERIYVDRELKGRGIGGLFIQKAVEMAKELGSKYIWLGVWEHNESAIRFYEKKGFRPYSQHIFKLGDDEQTDILMKRDMVYRKPAPYFHKKRKGYRYRYSARTGSTLAVVFGY